MSQTLLNLQVSKRQLYGQRLPPSLLLGLLPIVEVKLLHLALLLLNPGHFLVNCDCL